MSKNLNYIIDIQSQAKKLLDTPDFFLKIILPSIQMYMKFDLF